MQKLELFARHSLTLQSREFFQSKHSVFVADYVSSNADWKEGLNGQEVVIHTAGISKVSTSNFSTSLDRFRAVNVEGTIKIARQAIDAKVKRFIYISSVKVHGEFTSPPHKFSAFDPLSPIGPYAISKFEAEKALKSLLSKSDMELVIIRPPAVYGEGMKGNFRSLSRLVKIGLPLPFGLVQNKRSFVAIDNLVDLLVTCVDHPKAANKTFLVCDGCDLSTPELIKLIALGSKKPLKLRNVPVSVLDLANSISPIKSTLRPLLHSLQIDQSATLETLAWDPPKRPIDVLKDCF